MSQRPERSKHEAAKKKPESQLPNNKMCIRDSHGTGRGQKHQNQYGGYDKF